MCCQVGSHLIITIPTSRKLNIKTDNPGKDGSIKDMQTTEQIPSCMRFKQKQFYILLSRALLTQKKQKVQFPTETGSSTGVNFFCHLHKRKQNLFVQKSKITEFCPLFLDQVIFSTELISSGLCFLRFRHSPVSQGGHPEEISH